MCERFEKKLKFKVVEKTIKNPTKSDLLKCTKKLNDIYIVRNPKDAYLFLSVKKYKRKDLLDKFNIILDEKHLDRTPTEVWHDNIKKALKIINQTKMWLELIPIYENLLKITFEDHMLMQDISTYKISLDNKEELDKFNYIKEKYPFVIGTLNNKKNPCPQNMSMFMKPCYINELSNCWLKNINFDKEFNKVAKKEFIQHFQNKNSYASSYYSKNSYDCYFEYDSNEHKAWFNEELKRNNITHTYLAINENIGIYCETA